MTKVNYKLNHSAAHLLAASVLSLFPHTKLGIGPVIKEGFYYDFLFENPINQNDLKKIEKQMRKIAFRDYHFQTVNKIDFKNEPFKQELIADLKKQKANITYYGMVDPSTKKSIFSDLCKGDHIDSSKKIVHFKLLSLAGAYWKGDNQKPQLTRIYGTAWETEKELKDYLNLLEERKERDHRKIGHEMQIFMFSQEVGQGFPIWLPNGQTIKNTINDYLRKIEFEFDFIEVKTPAYGQKSLYKLSGHLDHYSQDMFPILKVDNEELVMRPMSCPHHNLIYLHELRSYRDLPLRISENALLYRYEKSGALTGLERVRAMELTDSHIFCTKEQIFDEFKHAYKLIETVLKKFEIEIDYVSLSLHDPKDKTKYYDDPKMWKLAENNLKKVLKELKIKYQTKIGEAAFYGPKIDIQVQSALGHEITLSTLQLDFLLPQRFGLTYIDANNQKQVPILIHRGLIGTYERFIAILLEQTKGNLPFWLAPCQIVIIAILPEVHFEYANKIYQQLKKLSYRVTLDKRDLRLGKKIREAQIKKIKWQILIGDNEVKNKKISVRKYQEDKTNTLTFEQFLKQIKP